MMIIMEVMIQETMEIMISLSIKMMMVTMILDLIFF